METLSVDALEMTKAQSGSTRALWRWSVGSMQDALSEAGDQWHELAVSIDAPPTALPFWYASLYEAFGKIDDPVVVHRLYHGRRLAAVLSLTFHEGMYRVWRPYQYRKHTAFWTFAFDGEIEGIGSEIRRHLLSSADLVDLAYVPIDSAPIQTLIDGTQDADMLLQSNEEEADIYNPLDAPWDQCVRHMSSRLARQTRQNRRRLQRQGNLVLSVTTKPEDIEPVLTECLELENSGWKGRNGTAILCLPAVERFYRALATRASALGMLGLYTLRLDGRLLACNFALRTGRRIDAIKIAYDEEMAHGSPGNVMNYTILEQECEKGRYAGFHWGNPTSFKRRWTDCTNRLVRLILFGKGARARCGRVTHKCLRPLAREVRDCFRQPRKEASKKQ